MSKDSYVPIGTRWPLSLENRMNRHILRQSGGDVANIRGLKTKNIVQAISDWLDVNEVK